MKGMFKKALAGVAAAALAVTGFAAASTAANAADPSVVEENATFTFTASDPKQFDGRNELTYYKLADYVAYGSGDTTVYGVSTPDQPAGLADAIRAALKTAGVDNVPTAGDPMAWAVQQSVLDNDQSVDSPWTAGTTRKFADALAKSLSNGQEATLQDTDNELEKTVSLPAGVYLFVDANGVSEGTTQAMAMIVYSGEVKDGTFTNPTQGREIDLKNEVTTVGKTVTGGVPGIGDTKSYTITGEVPNWVGKDLDSASYTFTDTPSKGQSVDFSSIKVTVNGEEIPAIDLNWTVSGTGVFKNANGGVVAADGESSFTIDLTGYLKTAALDASLIGKEIKVTYDVVINRDALTNDVTNKVEVDNNGSKAESSTTDQTVEKPAMLSFKKTEADGTTPLAGAQFSLTKEVKTESGTTQETVKVTWDETRQSYVVDPDGTAADGGTTTDESGQTVKNPLVSQSDGMVKVEGLGEGVYTVTETQAPEGFMNQFRPSFTVMVKADDTTTVVKYAEKSDAWDLISGTDESNAAESKVVVRNVRSVTELPQTGAAGIAMFVVLGLLIAGAGVTVWMKSRGVRNAING